MQPQQGLCEIIVPLLRGERHQIPAILPCMVPLPEQPELVVFGRVEKAFFSTVLDPAKLQ